MSLDCWRHIQKEGYAQAQPCSNSIVSLQLVILQLVEHLLCEMELHKLLHLVFNVNSGGLKDRRILIEYFWDFF